jgi:hypothetical protein
MAKSGCGAAKWFESRPAPLPWFSLGKSRGRKATVQIFLNTAAGIYQCNSWRVSPSPRMVIMWQPIFIILLFVIVLWRDLNCVKIPQGQANKSANCWGNLRAKGGVVPSSVYTVLSLARVRIKYIPPTRLRCLFLFSTIVSILYAILVLD